MFTPSSVERRGVDMPIVLGAGVSYSPLLYRPRSAWESVAACLRKGVIQPKNAEAEDAAMLADYERRITDGFAAIGKAIADGRLDALILLSADRGSQFDSSHIPQIHVQAGGSVWGDPAIPDLGEGTRRLEFQCEDVIAGMLTEELVRAGFDLAEAKGAFRPVGDPAQGLAPAAIESVARLAPDIPIIPISINCHVAPIMNGRRMHRFGQALARAADLADARIGVLVSGGLSGDPGGGMSGWIDDVFDQWVLARIARGRSEDLVRVWDVPSRNLLGGTTEVRLWMLAAAALEQAGCRAHVHDYMPIYHAAAGVAFVSWEN
jgi:hypothetical protein